MKRILGLDIGTTSIGWALVNKAEDDTEKSSIIKLGVRVNPLTTDEKSDFEKGNPLSTNADRTAMRGARRNLQRFKLRRKNLIEVLKKHNIINNDSILVEDGKNTTYQTLELRAKSVKEKIELDEFARVLLAINKKRGYKSNRKSKSTDDEGVAVDGMSIAKELYEKELTPGEYVYEKLIKGSKYIPDFYRSDLKLEFNQVWETQKQFYPDILDDELYKALEGQGQQNSRKRFLAIKKIYTAENEGIKALTVNNTETGNTEIKEFGKKEAKWIQHYQWRKEAIYGQLPIEQVAYVLVEINNNLNKSSGYLGAISDRGKEIFFNKQTVGEYLYNIIKANRHNSLKNKVFYRQDYLDEFEKIWETQANHHSLLTPTLKKEIRDIVIFYHRKLKSQKGLLSYCEFESWEVERKDSQGNIILNKSTNLPKKMRIGRKVISRSSPLFQEFKIWQILNNIKLESKIDNEIYKPTIEEKKILYDYLNIWGKQKAKIVHKLLNKSEKEWAINYKEIQGNDTNKSLYNVYHKIAELEGYGFDWEKKNPEDINHELNAIFDSLNINTDILKFDSSLENEKFEKQKSYQLWHLLYSAEDDNEMTISREDKHLYGSSDVNLKKTLCKKFGFKPEHAKLLAGITLKDDYGNLSTLAIRKILPYMKQGMEYSEEACPKAGYNHSHSLTKEDLVQKTYLEYLELLPKNSLRNPVVEKILNQMVNLINQVIKTYGKPDSVCIELARELKKSAEERKNDTKFINDRTKKNLDYKNIISSEFNIPNPTKNDVVRLRLYEELNPIGYKTVFLNKYIPRDKLFSKEIEIEHIIPKALSFDDSFSNKTLAYRETNLKKRDRTALDFIENDYNEQIEKYKNRVNILFNSKNENSITKGKHKKLLMPQSELGDGFIARDLKNTQYITKKAKAMLLDLFPEVVVTTGSITGELREDWELVNVMKELNLEKYRNMGLTEYETRKNDKKVEVIKDWTKRNDHRHHAVDALTVAFTTHNHIQYLNNLNARKNELKDNHIIIKNIENKIRHNGKFSPPMEEFRTEAKKHIESILVSIKAKNKVVTKNINKTKKGQGKYNTKVQRTPRGQLHKETVYGKIKRPLEKLTKISKKLTLQQVENIINPEIKLLIKTHLNSYENNPSIAFDTKTLKKAPLTYNDKPLKEVQCYEFVFTIRKDINPDNFKTEKLIDKIVDIQIKEIMTNRLKAYNNDSKKAFSDLDKNPIWLNKDKGIQIKSVSIKGVNNAIPLHKKKDHFGNVILNAKNKETPVDYVSTGNNHHIAIYIDQDGNLHERVVSLFEAVERTKLDLPIIDIDYNKDLGWKLHFTMKQNEMFVVPTDDFNPKEIDLMDDKNNTLISKHLYRVQKIAKSNYFFRHHLETTVNAPNTTKGELYLNISSTKYLKDYIKVRINNIGKIVHIGEY